MVGQYSLVGTRPAPVGLTPQGAVSWAGTEGLSQSKGDQDPATWMPALNRCEYAIEWVTSK